ncbi:MAG TPA: hypothetical protein PKE45_12155, partial [Caldilineaceae bacterium]|nr:hypothetical protein [Caldilineaceae bacterium]
DAAGNVVPGTTYLLVDFESKQAVGVGFTPSIVLKGPASATLKGGAEGVQAEDGRSMGGNYSWSFTLTPHALYLPLVTR